MKNICVFTSSRADFGILSNLLNEIKKSKKLNLNLVVTGSHLMKHFGSTIREIKSLDINVDHEISIFKKNNTSTVQDFSQVLIKAKKYLSNSKPDIVIVLGDRYEIFSCALAAFFLKIPIAHIHGGEVTSGSMDDSIRHSITKISSLHFTPTLKTKKRLLQLGENPKTIFIIGSISLDNLKNMQLLNKIELEKLLRFQFNKKIILFTYHPETKLQKINYQYVVKILEKIKKIKNSSLVITGTNFDQSYFFLKKKIIQFLKKNRNNVKYIESLGKKNFFSLMKISDCIIGNSSSGIIEAPHFKLFTINIGDRQNGREQAKSIFNSDLTLKSFTKTLNKVLTIKDKNKFFKNQIYKSIGGSKKIVKVLENYNFRKLKNKFFYDL